MSCWTALLSGVTVTGISKEELLSVKKTIVPSSSEVECGVALKPYPYLLKIEHNIRPGTSRKVTFNMQTVSSFKVSERGNADSTGDVRDYFYISPGQIGGENVLRISYEGGFPEKVKVGFRNYRQSFLGDNAIVTFRLPEFDFGFTVLRSGVVLPSVLLLLAASSLLWEGRYHRTIVLVVLIFNFVLSVIVLNNLLPLGRYVVAIDFAGFCFYYVLAASVVAAMFISRELQCSEIRENLIGEASPGTVRRYSLWIFMFFLVLLAILRLGLVADRRVPMGHDTFDYLLMQYNLFFNEPALRGNVPQWLPFITHGVVSNVKIEMSLGLFVSALLPFVRWIKHINFLPIFQAGLFFDELALLLGCTLLARDCFRSRGSIVFVVSSIVFTTISSSQSCLDFHLVYLVPLILYCMKHAFERSSARYLLLAGLFFVGTLLGNIAYVVPVIAFAIFVFGTALFFCMRSESIGILKQFLRRLRLRHLLAVAIPCLLGVCIFLFLRTESEHLSNHVGGRGSDFTVSDYETFVSYGGYVNVRKYLEFFSRGSNNIDNTIYAGLLVIPFAVLALLRVRTRVARAFGIAALIIALFSSGLLVPRFFYHLFPFGSYSRHIGLTAPLVKLFLVFFAGFGFELFSRSLKEIGENTLGPAEKANVLIPSVALLFIIFLAFGERFADAGIFDFSAWHGHVTESQLYLSRAQVCASMNAVLLISGLLAVLLLAILRWPKRATVVLSVLLMAHVGDVFFFKAVQEFGRAPSVSKDVVDLFDVYDYSFSSRRSQELRSNERFSRLSRHIFYEDEVPSETGEPFGLCGKYGALYSNLDGFVFADPISHVFRADYWLESVNSFYEVWGPSLKENTSWVGFPIPQSKVFRKLAGCDVPKLQMFSKIHVVPAENDVREILGNPAFAGDMLLCSRSAIKGMEIGGAVVEETQEKMELQADERIVGAKVSVTEFAFERLTVRVDNETGADALLYYADAWHPKWRAYVNGSPANIIRTNLGYKSVIVPPGRTVEVSFAFGDGAGKLLLRGMIVTGMCVFFAVICMLLTEWGRTIKVAASD